jgi:hypothetical protein
MIAAIVVVIAAIVVVIATIVVVVINLSYSFCQSLVQLDYNYFLAIIPVFLLMGANKSNLTKRIQK